MPVGLVIAQSAGLRRGTPNPNGTYLSKFVGLRCANPNGTYLRTLPRKHTENTEEKIAVLEIFPCFSVCFRG
jgi:hypothetical protein